MNLTSVKKITSCNPSLAVLCIWVQHGALIAVDSMHQSKVKFGDQKVVSVVSLASMAIVYLMGHLKYALFCSVS